MALPALVTILALILYLIVTFKVGQARGRYKVQVPATTGVNPDFDRYYRVQMNTLEQIVLFLPAMWLFAKYVSPQWASVFGLVWILGRTLHAIGYYKAASKRGLGFAISMLATSCLILGALAGIVGQLIG